MLVLRTLLSHYRQHPLQAVFLIAGITVANLLFTGTQLINAQARASYAQGEQLLNTGPVGQLRMRNPSAALDERHYIRLRQQGFDMLAPLLRRFVFTESGQSLEILGIDALVMPRAMSGESAGGMAGFGGFGRFLFPPFELWAAPSRLAQLGLDEGQIVSLAGGEALPPAVAAPDAELGHRLLTDLGILQELTDSRGQLSSIMVFGSSTERLDELLSALPRELEFVAADAAPDAAQLTRSFHLNLAAMGLLSFVVGVFLIYNALAFTYTDRRELIRKLRLSGVGRGELARHLLLELALFLVVGTALGAVLGGLLALRLLPGVGQTLAQLYGVYIAYPDSLVPSGLVLPLVMVLAAAVLCVISPMRQALDGPLLERGSVGWELEAAARRDRRLLVAGLVLLLFSLIAALTASNTLQALAGMAALLLGAAFCLPWVLRGLLGLLTRLVPARNARFSWLLADSRWLLGPASLALMAMCLALVANNGLNTMIGSFREATDDWLQQRFAAQIYLRGGEEIKGLSGWMENRIPGARIENRYRLRANLPRPDGQTVPVEIVNTSSDLSSGGRITLVRGTDGAEQAFRRGEGILVSERAWRLDGWGVGDMVRPCEGGPERPVLGVYYDYGNPRSQWMLNDGLFRTCWPGIGARGRAVLGPPDRDWSAIGAELSRTFELPDGSLIYQQELRQAALAVFDRTFTVTRALNLLTLLVAGIGIFCAVSAVHHHRVGQQALLASLGLSRRERGVLLLLQWGLLGLLCLVLVWPFGTALAGYLAAVVTPVAFGWSFALVLDASHYLPLIVVACGSLVAAVLLPSLSLLKTTPGQVLREQSA